MNNEFNNSNNYGYSNGSDDQNNQVNTGDNQPNNDNHQIYNDISQRDHKVDQVNHGINQANHDINQVNHDINQTNHDIDQVNHNINQADNEINQINNSINRTNDDMNQMNHNTIQTNDDMNQANHNIQRMNHDSIQSDNNINQMNNSIHQMNNSIQSNNSINQGNNNISKNHDIYQIVNPRLTGNYQGNYYTNSYNDMNQGNNNTKKPKKKGKFTGALKLTAAAVVFGLLAGTVFQGYNYLTYLRYDRIAEDKVIGELQPTEITEGSVDENSLIPTKSTPDSIVTDVSGVVENVMPSIVAINSSATITSYDWFGRQYNEPVEGSGSGIIVGQNDTELLVVTNNHVIDGADTVEIVFVDDTTATAIVKGADANTDLAVLSIDMDELSEETASKIKVATLGNSNDTKPGEMAIAIGNALGYGQSVTVGYISATEREVNIDNTTMKLLQTDAAINPGNSGGALINTSGQVIGINSVKYASQEVEGMGYAIPISDAIPMINELMNREVISKSEQGFLGINIESAQEVTEVLSQRFNMPIGVFIDKVVEGSPAEKAGLKSGDIIVKMNQMKIETKEDIINFLTYKRAGETIELVINTKENGDYVEKTLQVILEKRQ